MSGDTGGTSGAVVGDGVPVIPFALRHSHARLRRTAASCTGSARVPIDEGGGGGEGMNDGYNRDACMAGCYSHTRKSVRGLVCLLMGLSTS